MHMSAPPSYTHRLWMTTKFGRNDILSENIFRQMILYGKNFRRFPRHTNHPGGSVMPEVLSEISKNFGRCLQHFQRIAPGMQVPVGPVAEHLYITYSVFLQAYIRCRRYNLGPVENI